MRSSVRSRLPPPTSNILKEENEIPVMPVSGGLCSCVLIDIVKRNIITSLRCSKLRCFGYLKNLEVFGIYSEYLFTKDVHVARREHIWVIFNLTV